MTVIQLLKRMTHKIGKQRKFKYENPFDLFIYLFFCSPDRPCENTTAAPRVMKEEMSLSWWVDVEARNLIS